MTSRALKDGILKMTSGLTRLPGARLVLRRAIQRGIIPYSLWSRVPVTGVFVVPLGNGRHFCYSSTATDFVGRSLFWKGLDGYEAETTALFVTLARESRVVLDIGAHTGLYSLLACASNPSASIIAFEPVPRITERLRFQISLNGWSARCQTHCVAVSDADEMVCLHVPHGGTPHSASLDPAGFRGIGGDLISARAVTVDSFCAKIVGIDLIKIDVEGFEDRVVSGMTETLTNHLPAVVFEVLTGGPGEAVESILRPFGYRYYHLRPGGPVRVTSINAVPGAHYRNFAAAVRPDHIELLDQASRVRVVSDG